MENISRKQNLKQAGEAILISDKVDCKPEGIKKVTTGSGM
jgi:hypothetical protein